MSIITIIDRLATYASEGTCRTLRAKGILDEGYNPKRDAYEHTLFGLPFKSIKFTKVTTELIDSTFTQQAAEAKTPRPFYAKKKYEVVLPKGEVRRYRNLDSLTRDLILLRGTLTRYQGLNTNKGLLASLLRPDSVNGKKLRHTTGAHVSQLGCAHDAVITIRNLRTNKVLMRKVSNVFQISERLTASLA